MARRESDADGQPAERVSAGPAWSRAPWRAGGYPAGYEHNMQCMAQVIGEREVRRPRD